MEFPFHHHHGHHRRSDEDDGDDRRFPPPGRRPFDQGDGAYTGPPPIGCPPVPPAYGPYPPPAFGAYPPPDLGAYSDYSECPERYSGPSAYEPEPAYPTVQHVAHEVEELRRHGDHHRRHRREDEVPEFLKGSSVRVFCRADPDFSLSIRDGKVVLVRSNANDEFQYWIKDEKYSTKVKDEEGFPSFALVNKATGQAIKHSIGSGHPVQLCPYDPDVLDESVLWTESREAGEGFRAVRMVNNIRLNFDAFHGDKDHGGVRDGTILALWEWWKGDNLNQRWKIVPYDRY